jgi:hypothetical protein
MGQGCHEMRYKVKNSIGLKSQTGLQLWGT